MDLKSIKKKYSNGDITIVWNPGVCIHSTNCWKKAGGLPQVFDPSKRPWINPAGVNSDLIKKHVAACPSGAISIEGDIPVKEVKLSDILPKIAQIKKNKTIEVSSNKEEVAEFKPVETALNVFIEIIENGPIIIKNNCQIAMNNEQHAFKAGAVLCRCGGSNTKPFCDGTHGQINFKG